MSSNVVPDTFRVERWFYMGRCKLSNNKLGHGWRNEAGEEFAYDKVRGHAIGRVHEVEVSSDGRVRLSVRVLHDVPLHPDTPRWVAWDAGHYAAQQERLANKRLHRESRDKLGDLTLREVRDILDRAPSTLFAGTLAAILRYIGAA